MIYIMLSTLSMIWPLCEYGLFTIQVFYKRWWTNLSELLTEDFPSSPVQILTHFTWMTLVLIKGKSSSMGTCFSSLNALKTFKTQSQNWAQVSGGEGWHTVSGHSKPESPNIYTPKGYCIFSTSVSWKRKKCESWWNGSHTYSINFSGIDTRRYRNKAKCPSKKTSRWNRIDLQFLSGSSSNHANVLLCLFYYVALFHFHLEDLVTIVLMRNINT